MNTETQGTADRSYASRLCLHHQFSSHSWSRRTDDTELVTFTEP